MLKGNLRTMALPDVLQWIAMGQKTGTLLVERGAKETRIIFQDGQLFSSWSNDPRHSLGQYLIRDRRISEEQLFKALLAQERGGGLLGSILVADGLLDEEDLKQALAFKAEETIYDLFLWSEGDFEFVDGAVPDEVRIHIRLPVTAVILEGIRRVDEWARIREAFASSSATFKVQGASHQASDPAERQALGLAAAGKSLAEMSLEMRRSEFETASLLFDLHARGAVTVDDPGVRPQQEDPVGAIQDLLALAEERMREKRFDAALKAYEGVLGIDRLNQHAKKGLIAVAEARDRERTLRSVPLTKVPVLTIDMVALTREKFDPQEGFVLSRVNGQWDIQSILKLCPMAEDDALLIFARLIERRVVELRNP
jgi:hypothetical protein